MLIILVIHFLVCHSDGLSTRALFGIESHVDRLITMDLESKMTCLYEPLEKDMILKLILSPSVLYKLPMAMRLTSPSGEFSDWAEGHGEASMSHNVTENGDYEVCISATQPMRVTLNIFFHNPDKVEQAFSRYLETNELSANVQKCISTITDRLHKIFYSIKFSNKVSVRDEAMQQSSSDYIQTYVLIFCIMAIVVAVSEVIVVRRMFRLDNSRIRI